LDTEGTITVTEYLSLLLEHVWEDSLLVPSVIFDAVAIHEDIFLPRVAMEITKCYNVPLLLKLDQKPLEMEDDGMCVLLRVHPTSVQVYSSERNSRIPIDYSIDVHHWHDLDQEVVSEHLGPDRWPDQVV
jgi:hypothetical protein